MNIPSIIAYNSNLTQSIFCNFIVQHLRVYMLLNSVREIIKIIVAHRAKHPAEKKCFQMQRVEICRTYTHLQHCWRHSHDIINYIKI